MNSALDRRQFLKSTTALGLSALAASGVESRTAAAPADGTVRPIVIASGNGYVTAKAMELIQSGRMRSMASLLASIWSRTTRMITASVTVACRTKMVW
ncbi:MAG: hypothetical protein U1G07_03105 [Verrucomicrobiota bacterium]